LTLNGPKWVVPPRFCHKPAKNQQVKLAGKAAEMTKNLQKIFVSGNQKFIVQNQQYIYSFLVYFRTQIHPNIEEYEHKSRTKNIRGFKWMMRKISRSEIYLQNP
jgi:hypothetical protein